MARSISEFHQKRPPDLIDRMGAADLIAGFERISKGMAALDMSSPPEVELTRAMKQVWDGLADPIWKGDPPSEILGQARMAYRLMFKICDIEVPK